MASILLLAVSLLSGIFTARSQDTSTVSSTTSAAAPERQGAETKEDTSRLKTQVGRLSSVVESLPIQAAKFVSRLEEKSAQLEQKLIQKKDVSIRSNQVRHHGGRRHQRWKRSPIVSFRTRPSNQTAMLGDPVTLRCAAHEQNYLSVTWYKGGKALTPPFTQTIFVLWNNDLLVIANVDNANKYTFNATVKLEESHVFRCSPTGADRITWSKDGQPPSSFIDGKRVLQNRGDLVLTSVTRADSGRYTCTAGRNGDTQTIQAEATLAVVDVDIDGVCGRPVHAAGPDGLIVGGAEAEPGEFPWQAMLWDTRPTRNRFFCSGILINKRWVITAAHCIRELYLTKEDFIVRLGKHTTVRGVREASERSYKADRIIVHPDYNEDTLESDLALLRLAPPEVTFTEYILPICIPDVPEARQRIQPGAIGTVSGWGALFAGGSASKKLMKIILPVVSMAQCRSSHPQWAHVINQNVFCAGRKRGGKDACKGDSGGPFAAFYNGRWNLLGVVSWGDGCALRGKYGVYTRLHRFRDWIMEHTKEHTGEQVSFRTRPSNQTAMLGDPVTLRCAAHEQNDISVTWYKGGKALTPPSTQTTFFLCNNNLLVIANVDNADKYTCELRRGGASVSADAWITIQAAISACASSPCQHGGQCADNGSSCSCACPKGYTGDNCQIGKCEISRQPSNAHFSSRVYLGQLLSHGDTVEVACDAGYHLDGGRVVTCDNGTLALPTCNPRPCDDVPVLVNGEVDVTGLTHGSWATFRCDRGFRLDGPSQTTCYLGTWTILPSCESKLVIEADCAAYKASGQTTSGVYTLGSLPSGVQAYCDMDTAGGGWTVIQRRQDGSVPFNRTWEEYKQGFGNKNGEYWLGNENIHLLTSLKNFTLRIDLHDWEMNQRFAEYSTFRVSGESDQYLVHVAGYTGNAGDSMTYNNGQQFSTVDRDNDAYSSGHCSQMYGQGGWWYGSCGRSVLNGRYLGNCGNSCPVWQGVVWVRWRGIRYSLKSVSMKIRPS
ncbi:ANGPTL1 [Branchiostoma lanceolatum]|uniref:ANGPTL1 protein n=1 Tax=Branchiostoma lanceolatum TaxID=7740 RepID=A0A8J9VFE8_BRALA|nr:ANGPTL1 [Branchiostoma lanceolatum]